MGVFVELIPTSAMVKRLLVPLLPQSGKHNLVVRPSVRRGGSPLSGGGYFFEDLPPKLKMPFLKHGHQPLPFE